MAFDCIPNAVAKLFYIYGKFLGRHPLPFLLIPPIVALGLMVGIIKLESSRDTEYLYVPTNAESRDERERIKELFPHDDANDFSSFRMPEIGGFLEIYIANKGEGSVLNVDAVDAVFQLNEFVLNAQVKYKGKYITFTDICSLLNGDCIYNQFIEIMTNQSINDVTFMYPIHYNDGTYYNLVRQIGGVTLNNGIIERANAYSLYYYVRFQSKTDEERSTEYLNELRDRMLDYKDSRIDIEFRTSLTLDQELDKALGSVVPLFAITYMVLLIFAVLSCLMFDWVRSKPWVAVSGLVAAAFGLISSMGLLSVVGVPFASVIGTMPFLIMGIGLDNMFILVSAWRYTSVLLDTEERVALTLQGAAVSITITTLTDALAFGVGCLTPFRSVTFYCAYTGVAIVFVYFYMITFTAACMAYSGRREAANRHAFACRTVPTRSQAADRSRAYRICCASGDIPDPDKSIPVTNGSGASPTEKTPTSSEPEKFENGTKFAQEETRKGTKQSHTDEDDVVLPFMNVFLGTKFADLLMTPPMKVFVLLVYAVFLAGAIYGITILEEGLDRANLAPDDSYFRDYVKVFDRDFGERFGPVISVIFDETLDYSDATVRDNIDKLVDRFQNNKYFVDEDAYVTSWLMDYEEYLVSSGQNINDLNTTQFIAILRNDFLTSPAYKNFRLDVVFNHDNTSIRASRLFMQTTAILDAVDEKNLLFDSRDIAEKSDYKTFTFTPFYVFWDQYAVILVNTLQNLGIAIVSIALVSLALIPSITTVVWVTLATVSICTCIIGYMAIWDVTLDSVSMIDLVMCIGFSVDFAAHISYHFVASQSDDPKENARDAMGHLGTPIIQGALSTVLAVLILVTSTSYIFRTFFKLVLLVIGFGFFHAMFLLPVLLSTFQFTACCKKKKATTDGKTQTSEKTQAQFDNLAYT